MTSNIKGLLIDLSGTIHIDSKAIPGAVEAIRKLRASDLPFRFATNTTKVSSQRLVEKLNKMGFEVQEHEIFTSLSACRDKVASQKLRPFLLMEDAAMDEFKGLDTSDPNAVVVGLAPSKFNYAHMNKAFRLLTEDKTRPLIAVHKAKYFADVDEELSMGPGGFVEALEYAAGVQSTVVGKPTKSFFQLALAQIGMHDTPRNVAIIGDDVNNDLGGGAIELGLHRFLVRTGKYRPGDEDSHKDDGLHVFESVVEAINDVLAQNK